LIATLEGNYGIADVDVEVNGGEAAIDAGEYEVVVTLTAYSDEGEAYAFENGETELVLTLTLTIAPRTIFVEGIKANDKSYDGKTDIVIDTSDAEFIGIIETDKGYVQVRVKDGGDIGHTENAAPGKGKLVYIEIELSGDADKIKNYSINGVADVTVNIRATGVEGENDENPDDDLVISDEIVALIADAINDKTVVYNKSAHNDAFDANIAEVLNDYTDEISGFTVSFDKTPVDAGCYTAIIKFIAFMDESIAYAFENGEIYTEIEATLFIIPKNVSLNGVSAVNREYDGSVYVDINVNNAEPQFGGLISGDNLGFEILNGGKGYMANASVGTEKVVTVEAILTGADAKNYSLEEITGIRVTIRATGVSEDEDQNDDYIVKSETVEAIEDAISDKTVVYNKTPQTDAFDAEIEEALMAYEGKISGYEVIFESDPINAGEYTATIVLEAYEDSDEAYAFANGERYIEIVKKITVKKKALIVEGATPENRAYDGSVWVNVNIPENPEYDTIFADDDVEVIILNNGKGYMTDANAGQNKAVYIDVELRGDSAENYETYVLTGFKVNIAKQIISANVTAHDKKYDGTTQANVDVSFTGLKEGETLTEGVDYVITAEYDSAEAGNDRTVNVTVELINSNYTFESGTGVSFSLDAEIAASADELASWGWLLIIAATIIALLLCMYYARSKQKSMQSKKR
jgi:hypothetical protein